MTKLFLDIETLPCDEKDREMVVEILKKKSNNAEKDPDELFLQTGFDGTFGRICCIGYIKEYDNGTIEKGVLKGDEKQLLLEFWEVAKDAVLFIGHNVMEFDLPFIYQRSMVLNVRPSQNLMFARYRNNPIYDTMKEWSKWAYNAGPRLDTLAKVLSLPTSKDAMDGSQVFSYFQEGRIDEIAAYCMKDVVLTRQVYYRMNFSTASDIPGIEEYTKVTVVMTDDVKVVVEKKKEPTQKADQASLLGDIDEIPF